MTEREGLRPAATAVADRATSVAEPGQPTDTSVAGQNPSLGRQIRVGLRWSVGNMVAARALSLASGVVLARLLAPRDYGVFAIALVATDLLMSVNDAGLIAAIVRHPGDARSAARTAFTLTLGISCLLYLLLFTAAPFYAQAIHAPDATGVVRLLTVAILIDGVSAVPSGLLTRGLRQDLRAIGDVTGLVVSIVVSVVLALMGLGVWSLAWGRLIGNGTAAVIFLALSPIRVWPGFDRREARKLMRFGMPMAGASLVSFGLLNIHYVVVGSILGPVQLGLYVLAFNLSSWPVSLLSQAAQRVSLAGFAQLVDQPEALRRGFSKALLLLMAATVPTALLLALLAQPLIRFLYGTRWEGSIDTLRFLAVMAAVRVAANLIQDLLAALGHAGSVLSLQLTWALLMIPCLLVGTATHGIAGAGIAQAAVAVVMLPVFILAVHRAGVGIRQVLARLPSLGYAAAATAAVCLVLLQLVSGDLTRLLVVGPLGLAAFGVALLAAPGFKSVLGDGWRGLSS